MNETRPSQAQATSVDPPTVGDGVSGPTPAGDLRIVEIETIPIRVPLARVYRGSGYQMTHRSTIVCRVRTGAGVSARPGPATKTPAQLEIDRIIQRRDRAGARAARTPSRSSAAGRSPARRRTTSCATAASAWSRAPASTRRSGTRSARRSASRSGGSGADTADATDDRDRRLLRRAEHRGRGRAAAATLGLAGMKFKVGGRSPEEDAARFAARARPPATTSSSAPTPTRAGHREEAIELCAAGRGLRPSLVRGAVPLGQRPAGHARRPRDRRRPGVRRPERVLGRRLPRADGGRRDRRLQLRRVVVGRADRMAPGRRHRALLRRRHGPSRGAAGRMPPPGRDSARHVRRVLPPRSRPDLVERFSRTGPGFATACSSCGATRAWAGSSISTSSTAIASARRRRAAGETRRHRRTGRALSGGAPLGPF